MDSSNYAERLSLRLQAWQFRTAPDDDQPSGPERRRQGCEGIEQDIEAFFGHEAADAEKSGRGCVLFWIQIRSSTNVADVSWIGEDEES